MTVICDWLDVTYAPNDTPERSVIVAIQSGMAECIAENGPAGSVWRLNGGTFKIDYRATFARFSASGSFIEGLRVAGVFQDYLSALSESPHSVTRLDAAYDVLTDAAPVIAKLRKRFPRECSLTRKALKTKSILQTRDDGQESGTWYVGHRSKGRVTARVYDKQLEVLEKQGTEIPPMTRYELTFKKDIGVTLRDAAEPDRVFWHYAAPVLLKRPQNVPEWSSGWGGGWSYERPEVALAGVLKGRVQSSAELQSLIHMADKADCLDWLIELITREIQNYEPRYDHEPLPEWETPPAMAAYAREYARKTG